MSVWLTIPSARPVEEANKVLSLWRRQGYKIALWRDEGKNPPICDALETGKYPGYSAAVNALIQEIMDVDETAEWFVIGGDDVEPDKNRTASEIILQLRPKGTFAVMQPTGDRFAGGSIDRIAGSAWIGREFVRRMYGGNGPLWPEYTRFFMDEELQLVAQKYGVFQQRRDLIHLHRWYGRASEHIDSGTAPHAKPPHLAHQEARWGPEKAIFQKRRAEGFPGSEPIA